MVEDGDQFGAALAAGDFNHDGFADLAAGAPFEAVGSAGAAGAFSMVQGSAAGLTTSGGAVHPGRRRGRGRRPVRLGGRGRGLRP
jgi:hypothetical protein